MSFYAPLNKNCQNEEHYLRINAKQFLRIFYGIACYFSHVSFSNESLTVLFLCVVKGCKKAWVDIRIFFSLFIICLEKRELMH